MFCFRLFPSPNFGAHHRHISDPTPVLSIFSMTFRPLARQEFLPRPSSPPIFPSWLLFPQAASLCRTAPTFGLALRKMEFLYPRPPGESQIPLKISYTPCPINYSHAVSYVDFPYVFRIASLALFLQGTRGYLRHSFSLPKGTSSPLLFFEVPPLRAPFSRASSVNYGQKFSRLRISSSSFDVTGFPYSSTNGRPFLPLYRLYRLF